MNIGKVIRRRRKALHRDPKAKTQEVISGQCLIARSLLAMIKCGKKENVQLGTIWRISNAFNIKPHVLIKEIENEIEATENRRK